MGSQEPSTKQCISSRTSANAKMCYSTTSRKRHSSRDAWLEQATKQFRGRMTTRRLSKRDSEHSRSFPSQLWTCTPASERLSTSMLVRALPKFSRQPRKPCYQRFSSWLAQKAQESPLLERSLLLVQTCSWSSLTASSRSMVSKVSLKKTMRK